MEMHEYCFDCPVAKLAAGYKILYEAGIAEFPPQFLAMMLKGSSPSGNRDLTMLPPCANDSIGYTGHRLKLHSVPLYMTASRNHDFSTCDLASAQVRFVPDGSSGCDYCNAGFVSCSSMSVDWLAKNLPGELLTYWRNRWQDLQKLYFLNS